MVVLNNSGEEVNVKLVYYGPGLSGKTTNLEYVYGQAPADLKGQLVSMKTRTDRTLFFDYFPLDAGEINGRRTRLLLYTVPGQVFYNATRKLVLKGVDAIVFVADSARDKLQENIESLRNLEDNLNEHNLSLDNVPWVIQYNKRDLPDALSIEELHQHLNLLSVPAFEAVATSGHGVNDTLQGVTKILYAHLDEKYKVEETAAQDDNQNAVVTATQEPAPEEDVEDVIDFALREVSEFADTPAESRTPVSQPAPAAEPPRVQSYPPETTVRPEAPAAAAEAPQSPAPVSTEIEEQPVAVSEEAIEAPVPATEEVTEMPVTGDGDFRPSYSDTAAQVPEQTPPVSEAASPHESDESSAETPAETTREEDHPTHEMPAHPPLDEPEQSTVSPQAEQSPVTTSSEAPEEVSSLDASQNAFTLRSGDSEVSEELGRTLELDETTELSQATKKAKEFIIGPLQTSSESEEEVGITQDVMPSVAPAETESAVQEIEVPVIISRSQVKKSIPLKLRLEIHVIDD